MRLAKEEADLVPRPLFAMFSDSPTSCTLMRWKLILVKSSESHHGIKILGAPKTLFETCIFFFLFMAAPVAYGSSQTRGQIRAADARLYHSHSNMGSKPHLQPIPQLTAVPDLSHICDLHHSLQQFRNLNPLSKSRSRSASSQAFCWVLNLLSRNGNFMIKTFLK